MTEPIGVLAFWKNYDRKTYLRAAQLAEELGYDSFWVPEAWGYEAFSLLCEIANHTKTIKVGTGIVNVFSRTPGLMAMSAATIDEISEGRFILGIGTSGIRVIQGFHGREFKRPLTQVRDVIRVVQALLAGTRLSAAGAELHDYRPFDLAMTPRRRKIPIYVAALKEKAITSIGELADGWMPTFWPFDKLARGQAWIAAGAVQAGRNPADVVTAPFTPVIPLGAEVAGERAKEIIAFYIGGMGDYYKELLADFGYGEDCRRIEALYKNKDTRAQAKDAVGEDLMHALTISGDPRFCVEELRRRRKTYNIGLPILNLPPQVPYEVVDMFLRAMAPTQR